MGLDDLGVYGLVGGSLLTFTGTKEIVGSEQNGTSSLCKGPVTIDHRCPNRWEIGEIINVTASVGIHQRFLATSAIHERCVKDV